MGYLYVGIDLAIRKRKRLPIAVCRMTGPKVTFLGARNCFPPPPSGMGNVGALDERQRARFVQETVQWLREVQRLSGDSIGRIAIDAPSTPCRDGASRRLAELGLDRAGISCFSTPTRSAFEDILAQAHRHIAQGRAEACLPHANKIWMLVGFDLFAGIRWEWECIEVYPQAIARSLGEGGKHKSTAAGFAAQRQTFARTIGVSDEAMKAAWDVACFGAPHDRLDAMMAAWVASLPSDERVAYGDGLEDAIWVPVMSTGENRAPPAVTPTRI